MAFTADRPHYNEEGRWISFSTVTTNEGNAFNGTTGVFTCPVAGVYFSEFPLVFGEQYVIVLIKNKKRVQAIDKVEHGYGRYGARNALFLKLNVGERIRLLGEKYAYSYSQTTTNTLTFSGFLMSPDT